MGPGPTPAWTSTWYTLRVEARVTAGQKQVLKQVCWAAGVEVCMESGLGLVCVKEGNAQHPQITSVVALGEGCVT